MAKVRKEGKMVNVIATHVEVMGVAKPGSIYVPVQVGTALLSSSDKVTVHAPGSDPVVIELRQNTSGTFRTPQARIAGS